MREFNYQRAWEQWANPRFQALLKVPEFRAAWDVTVALSPKIRQMDRSTERLRLLEGKDSELPCPKEFQALLNKLGSEAMREAAYVADNWGHWGSSDECGKTAGATWKFRIFCGYLVPGVHNCSAFNVKEFMDHKPGTSYDNEEIVDLLRDATVLCLEKVISANWKVNGQEYGGHPFVIGEKHFPRDGGMFIRPEQAPCCHCGHPYDAHTHDEVLLIRGTQKMTMKELKTALVKLNDLIESHNLGHPNDKIRVDGFGFPDGIPQEKE